MARKPPRVVTWTIYLGRRKGKFIAKATRRLARNAASPHMRKSPVYRSFYTDLLSHHFLYEEEPSVPYTLLRPMLPIVTIFHSEHQETVFIGISREEVAPV